MPQWIWMKPSTLMRYSYRCPNFCWLLTNSLSVQKQCLNKPSDPFWGQCMYWRSSSVYCHQNGETKASNKRRQTNRSWEHTGCYVYILLWLSYQQTSQTGHLSSVHDRGWGGIWAPFSFFLFFCTSFQIMFLCHCRAADYVQLLDK